MVPLMLIPLRLAQQHETPQDKCDVKWSSLNSMTWHDTWQDTWQEVRRLPADVLSNLIVSGGVEWALLQLLNVYFVR